MPIMVVPGNEKRPQKAQTGGGIIKCGSELFGSQSISGMLGSYLTPNIRPDLVVRPHL